MKIFIPENNLGNEASYMEDMLINREDVITFWQKNDRPGIRKGPGTADDYVHTTGEYLRTGRFTFSHDLFTTTKGRTPKQMKSELQEQLERYHVEIMLPNNEFGKIKRVVTGKGCGIQDDLAISTLQCNYWGIIVQSAPNTCFR